MKISDFKLSFGSLNSDHLSSPSNTIAFGMNGNDSLSSVPNSEFNVLAGGAGNDTYYAGRGAATTIVDTGGDKDALITTDLGLRDSNTYAATIDGGSHILVQNIKTGTQVAVANWQLPNYAIENVTLADGTYSLDFIKGALYSMPGYLGDISTEQLVQYGILPHGTTSSDLLEIINQISVTEVAKIAELSGQATPNVQHTNLSIIVTPGVLDNKAVLLENLKETFTHQNGKLVSHTVEYAGTAYNYSDLDSIITTVVRDGEFTQEFAQEIADFDPGAAGVSYQTAVQLIGQAYINDTLLYVAGADGSYIS